MEPQQSVAIRTEALSKHFGSFVAVDAVSFEVRPGEVFGLLGPNGAGKTTIIRMLTTLLRPTSGRAEVAGYDVVRDAHRVREAIGVIPQAMTSDLDLTGWENLDIYGEFYGVPRRQRRERGKRLLHMVGLTERADELVATYSGGMRRRLEIARGLMHEPRVLFLDEPTIGLDPQSRRVVWELLERLRRETELTISLTTHYMDEAEYLCDRIAIVDGGKIVALDTPTASRQASKRRRPSSSSKSTPTPNRSWPACAPCPTSARLPTPTTARSAFRVQRGRAGHSRNHRAHRVLAAARWSRSAFARLSLEDVFIHFTGRTLRDSSRPERLAS